METQRYFSSTGFLICSVNWLEIPLLWVWGFVPGLSEAVSFHLLFCSWEALGLFRPVLLDAPPRIAMCVRILARMQVTFLLGSLEACKPTTVVCYGETTCLCICVCPHVWAQSYPSVSTGSWFLVFLGYQYPWMPKAHVQNSTVLAYNLYSFCPKLWAISRIPIQCQCYWVVILYYWEGL